MADPWARRGRVVLMRPMSRPPSMSTAPASSIVIASRRQRMIEPVSTGIADGVAIFDLMKERRPDMMVFANRDAVRVNPRFSEMIIPVEWREEHKSKLKTRETLVLTNKTVEDGKAAGGKPGVCGTRHRFPRHYALHGGTNLALSGPLPQSAGSITS